MELKLRLKEGIPETHRLLPAGRLEAQGDMRFHDSEWVSIAKRDRGGGGRFVRYHVIRRDLKFLR